MTLQDLFLRDLFVWIILPFRFGSIFLDKTYYIPFLDCPLKNLTATEIDPDFVLL